LKINQISPIATFLLGALFFTTNGCARHLSHGIEDWPFLIAYYDISYQDLCAPWVTEFSVIQPGMADRMQSYLQYQASLGSASSVGSTRLFGTVYSGNAKWEGGALAPNGKIYGARFGAGPTMPFLEIDPNTLTTALVGPASNTGSGMVLLPSGLLLEIPHTGVMNPVVLNPNTGATTTLSGSNGGVACSGGVLAPNGKVYCTAQSGTSGALEIDPVSGSVTIFGAAQLGLNYGGSAVLGLNGKIYAVPYAGTTQIAEIDPTTRGITLFGPSLTANNYYGGILAPSGKIYLPGFTTSTILEVDPIAHTVTSFGNTGGSSNYLGAAVAPNGHIYLTPRSSAVVLEFDPVTHTQTTFGSGWGAAVTAFDGGILAPNGKIYAFPLTGSGNNQQPLEIDPKANGNYCPAVARSAYFNKF